MVWDFAEANPFGGSSGDVRKYVEGDCRPDRDAWPLASQRDAFGDLRRVLPLADESQDAVITDPPYYDNISYADLSDFFYVWLKRSVGFLYPDDLGGQLTPKRNEAVVAPYRHHGRQGRSSRLLRADDGRRLRRGSPGAQARCAAGLHLRAQDHTRLGHAGRSPSHRRVHDHRSVAPGHGDAGAVGRPGHRESRIVDLPGRAQTRRRRRGGQRVRRYGRTRQDHRRAARSAPAAWCDRRRPRHRHGWRWPARI